MSCPYYTFRQGDYYCTKKSDYVNSDVYYKYCKNYDYDDCPIYKGDTSGSGCFITTACVEALGCADDGAELTILRNFRDTYMNKSDKLRTEVQEYYKTAPKVVEKINLNGNFIGIYKEIYNDMILPCLSAIGLLHYDEAYMIYKEEFVKLKEKYLN